MSDYSAPVRDMAFVLGHVVDYPGVAAYDGFAHADLDTVNGVLEECGRFMAEVLAPLNRIGDTEGSRLDADGTVTVPAGFVDAYRSYVDAGWGSVPFPGAHGGGDFPWVVGIAMQEMMTSANMGFSLCPLLTQGAIDAVLHWGSEEQQEQYLRKMVSGQWTGTMNLTEPHAGSDVGALTTRAVPAEDGSFRITGQKIFITYGEHEMAENIVHLVLARTPDAPPGTKGISCFIVPKFLLDAEGNPAGRNDVRCVSIEHKLGIHASPTCVLSYGDGGEGAIGYLIGQENAGMRVMFTMMNNARLSVGLQGLALGERAYQQALTFAQERVQGRAIGATTAESPIIEHADVRRMLMTMKAYNEAMRCLIYLNGASMDRAAQDPDPDVRQRADDLVALLTPVSKGFGTDLGVEVTSLNVQIHGGMGFIEETGAAQHFRDSRIAPIYEGTNGIQAADLVGRKLPMRGGQVVADQLAAMEATAQELAGSDDDTLRTIGAHLSTQVEALAVATRSILERGAADPNEAMAASTPYLRMIGLVIGGWLLAKSAKAATDLAASGGDGFDEGFLDAKITTARFYATNLLPQAAGLLAAIESGKADLFAIEPKHLVG